MIYVYKILVNLIILFSPIIIIIRILNKKEHPIRFFEKFSFFSKERREGNLIWFHAVSVGELLSIIPIIKVLEKKKYISQILVTSSTLSSAKLFTKFNFKKTIHQFFPIDNDYFTNKFIRYWKPKLAIFVDSEIWPNMLANLKRKKIQKVLLNARISHNSFKKWNLLKSFSKLVFANIDYFFPQNLETKKFLKKLNVKKIKSLGNLKFINASDYKLKLNTNLKKISKKKIFCAASTHEGEEKICVEIYYKLQKKYKDLLLIIIPRHINRSEKIIKLLKEYNMKYQLHSKNEKFDNRTNAYIVDTYGETEIFFKISSHVLMGKSITKDGGQNPLEAARNNCVIFHGPKVSNFTEIYEFLNQKKIAFKIKNTRSLYKALSKSFKKKVNKKSKNKLNRISKTILKNNIKEIEKIILSSNAV
ncbi:3-deoxy-D-manno-octulosonic acid transferase [Candidatus Pelagibacter bacterium]|jgi:3-deoxy-D-manno-octulosonic-acid transferase|nr:3-deoxy-D-manno-octulosonic acid transferase [Candidatus Pelagibacter bacterium]